MGDAPGGQFKFIPLQTPAALRDISIQRVVRSHAARTIRRTTQLREKRMLQNFRVLTVEDMQRSSQPASLKVQPAIHVLDPFTTLPASSRRFQELINSRHAKQAAEPVFAFESTTPFGSSTGLYNSCFANPAFLNALMLSLVFTENNERMSVECWTYRGEAMRNLASLLEVDETTVDETTIGAILILTGVDYRSGSLTSHATHMFGISRILHLRNVSASRLSGHTKRSIFWQDLNGAMISGCARIFDHETFPELHWNRQQLPGYNFDLPPGFENCRDLFSAELITVLEDLNGFRRLRETTTRCHLPELERMIYIDNAQAWNESRLCDLGTQSSCTLVGCCLTAAYICSYSLFCEIWHGTFMTSRLSARLLQQVCAAVVPESRPEHYKELFLWLIYIGAAFSDDEDTRVGFIKKLHPDLCLAWGDTVSALRRFIWSDGLHYNRCFSVWAQSQTFQNELTENGDEHLLH